MYSTFGLFWLVNSDTIGQSTLSNATVSTPDAHLHVHVHDKMLCFSLPSYMYQLASYTLCIIVKPSLCGDLLSHVYLHVQYDIINIQDKLLDGNLADENRFMLAFLN